ncbi:helix-turn-helix domain-containing protein [Streptomyces sp. NPDC052396]|uniref:helix-turn-helix domain-containing protein n=1 Tax=Streptomyces sp. NPDC052396 TaxID=3365689 RepID=UPI0037D128B1
MAVQGHRQGVLALQVPRQDRHRVQPVPRPVLTAPTWCAVRATLGSAPQDPYADPRAFYGSELCRLRAEAGLTQTALGELAFRSGSYVGRFETAARRPQLELSKLFDEILGSGQHLRRLCRPARASKVADYFADAADLERQAAAISAHPQARSTASPTKP